MRLIDMTGQRFGKLVALRRTGPRRWLFKCDCGNEHEADRGNVNSGATRSCGCIINRTKKSEKHGMTGTPEQRAWRAMITRTTNPNTPGAKDYVNRGIKICDEWRSSFAAFFAEVGPRPTPAHSIDRIDNNRGYEPGNIRWATPTEQQRNRRCNNLLTVGGVTCTMAEWAEKTGIGRTTLDQRVAKGWTGEQIFSKVRGK